MSVEIRSIRGDVIFTHAEDSLRRAVEVALSDDVDLTGADFAGADLRGVDFGCVRFDRVNFEGADLTGSSLEDGVFRRVNFRGANLTDVTISGAAFRDCHFSGMILAPDMTWDRYNTEVVPRLLTAGGRTLDEVLATGCWECHSWSNCPLHAAFGAQKLDDILAEYRSEAELFMFYFNHGILPEPTP